MQDSERAAEHSQGESLGGEDVDPENGATPAWSGQPLAEPARMLRALVDASPVPIVAIDLGGCVWLWNPAAERAFGWTAAEVLGRRYPAVPDEKSGEFRQLIDTVAGGTTLAGVELRRVRKDGTPIDVALSAAPLRDDRGDVIGIMAIQIDITDSRRSLEALRESEEKYRSIFENVQDIFYQTEAQGLIVEVSPSAARLGYAREALIGTSVLELYADPGERAALVQAVLERGEVSDYEIAMKRGDGGVLAASVSAHLRHDAAGKIIGFEGSLRDISERKRLEAQLAQMANHDPLTGLFNRHRFDDELRHHVSTARRYGLRGVLLFMDLDQFKDVNDTRGHRAGDELLCGLAGILRQRLRETDVIARFGGDEFAVLLAHTETKQASAIASALLEAIRNHTFVVAGAPLRITASIGMAEFPDGSAGAGEILSRADLAMYRAKDGGRDRLCVFAPDDDDTDRRGSRLNYHQQIRDALEHDRFVLHAQPVLDLRTGSIGQYELLLRMVDGQALILPGQFLDTAERTGLIHDIDRWTVRSAIQLIAAHPHARGDLRMEVNVSGKAFGDPELLPMIRREIAGSGVAPANLILEVTETAAIANINGAQTFARALQDAGCGFALDDFGVGFSSFTHLKQLPVDYLKIDGSFVRDLARNEVDQHLVQAIVGVARGLGKRTIAEFVGDAETLTLLREYGVDFAQGYHIGRPGPIADVVRPTKRAA